MSEQGSGDSPSLSDADKVGLFSSTHHGPADKQIRLKRLARLGNPQPHPSPSSSESGTTAQPSEASQTAPTPRAPPSATSRLLSQAASPAPVASSSTSTPPRKTSPAKPAETKKPISTSSLGKRRPSPALETPKARVGTPQQKAPPKVPYAKWEVQAITNVFSASLTVSDECSPASRWSSMLERGSRGE